MNGLPANFVPSAEQRALVEAPLTRRSLVLVKAFAGAGKTTTLKYFAVSKPAARILYLCFGRANADEARKTFPGNVHATTVHKLAMDKAGGPYLGKIHDASKIGEIKPMDVVGRLDCDISDAKEALTAIAAWLNTTDAELTNDHLALELRNSGWRGVKILQIAQEVWKGMLDPQDCTMKISPDAILWMWVKSNPVLNEYDFIVVDEAQDSNPLTLALTMRQWERGYAGLIFVGDEHQNIFGFRNTANAMKIMADQATNVFRLTQSYRFTPNIGILASTVLKELKAEHTPVVGLGRGVEKPRNTCYLGRMNTTLIHLAHAILERKPDSKFFFAGTSMYQQWSPRVPYHFLEIEEACQLALVSPGMPVPRFITRLMKPFATWQQFKEYVNTAGDAEALRIKKFVDDVGAEHLPQRLAKIESACVSPNRAYHVFSTAHKAKGLEWGRVKILGDFPNLGSKKVREALLEARSLEDETNLLYVAITRTKGSLEFGLNLKWLVHSPDVRDTRFCVE